MGPVARAAVGLVAVFSPLSLVGFIAVAVFVAVHGFWLTLGLVILGLLTVAGVLEWLFLGILAMPLKGLGAEVGG
jgi:hypothetical protein